MYENWRKANFSLVFKKVGSRIQGGETYLNPWEGNGAANTGAFSRHIKGKKAIRNSHNRFTKGQSQSHLTKLITFYEKMTVLVVKRRAVDYSFN